jgi:hypothetical protein
VIFCVGRGSAITGRGAHLILLDDPIKDRKEADSLLIRDGLWNWYNQVLRTRLMNRTGTIVLINTRWSEDDLSGRLVDPLNPHYSIEEARLWRSIDLPALADDDDVLGRQPGEPLWPERFDAEYLKQIRASDPRGFQALYQGKPSPREGFSASATWSATTRCATCRRKKACASMRRRIMPSAWRRQPTRPACCASASMRRTTFG